MPVTVPVTVLGPETAGRGEAWGGRRCAPHLSNAKGGSAHKMTEDTEHSYSVWSMLSD